MLIIVMLVCIPFAWMRMSPRELKDFAQSVVAVSLFGSNILFLLESGYFNAAAELKPLLHTWSLAVEEQYYVLFPLFLMLAWRLGTRWILAALAVVAVLSLGFAEWSAHRYPDAAFYLRPFRMWELLLGAFAAFHLAHKPQGLAEARPMLGQNPGRGGADWKVTVSSRSGRKTFRADRIPLPAFFLPMPTERAQQVRRR